MADFNRYFKNSNDLFLKEEEASDLRLRFESEIDEMKIRILKLESDLSQESELRRVAENEASAAKMVAENLLRESQNLILR